MRNPISPAPSALVKPSPFSSLVRRLVGPVLTAGALGSALLLAPTDADAQTKIAIVDVQRAITETEDGLRIRSQLSQFKDKRKAEIIGKERALAQEQDEIVREERAGKTPKEVLQRKVEAFQKKYFELQNLSAEANQEMMHREREALMPIQQRILGIIRRIAAQEGYEMVLEKAVVPYFRSDLEITDRAIQMYNSGQAGDVPAGPQPKGPAKQPAQPAAPAKQGAEQPKPTAPATPKAATEQPKPAAPAAPAPKPKK
jgi:outer membrane protein